MLTLMQEIEIEGDHYFSMCGSCISWKSQLQYVVALSSTETEYIPPAEVAKETIWLKGLLNELGFLKQEVLVYLNS